MDDYPWPLWCVVSISYVTKNGVAPIPIRIYRLEYTLAPLTTLSLLIV